MEHISLLLNIISVLREGNDDEEKQMCACELSGVVGKSEVFYLKRLEMITKRGSIKI